MLCIIAFIVIISY